MNTPLKKLCIFGLADGLGNMIAKQVSTDKHTKEYDRERIIYRASLLSKAGQEAVDKCHVKKDNNAVKNVKKKIDLLCKNTQEFGVVEMLNILFLGISDLEHFCKDTKYIEPIKKRTLFFMKLYDSKLEQEEIQVEAAEKYDKWINS